MPHSHADQILPQQPVPPVPPVAAATAAVVSHAAQKEPECQRRQCPPVGQDWHESESGHCGPSECGVSVITDQLLHLSESLTICLFRFIRKSTFFNVLTKSQAAAENFPFCTIDPNENKYPLPQHLRDDVEDGK